MDQIFQDVLMGVTSGVLLGVGLLAKSVAKSWTTKLNTEQKAIVDTMIDGVVDNSIKAVEEVAFQHWKADDKKEISGEEKKVLAVTLAKKNLEANGINIDDKAVEVIANKIEGRLPVVRNELDNLFDGMKHTAIDFLGKIPENSTEPKKRVSLHD
jgi:hypothetical protein